MTHKVGVYWAPHHDQRPVLDYIAALKPPVVRVMTEDVQHISDAYSRSPTSIIIPRIYHIDDDGGRAVREMNENPTEAGKKHVTQTVAMIDLWRSQAATRGIPFPPQEQIIIGGANEPNAGAKYPIINDYARSFGFQAMRASYRAVLVILGVGHPATSGKDWASWKDFSTLQAILDAGNHWVETHGYWQREGPFHEWTDIQGETRRDYPALAGRHHACTLKAPHLIGECGIDGGIFDRNPRYGWGNYGLSVDEFSKQLEVNHDALAHNVVAMLPYTSDYQNDEWGGFDVIPVHDSILAWASQKHVTSKEDPDVPDVGTPPNNVFMPVIIAPDDDETMQDDDEFEEAVKFVLSWEGGYVNDPIDPGGETNFGISKRAHPDEDIENMTLERAKEIYHDEYWEPAAGNLSWPLSLVYFDTAVLHGPGAAEFWLDKYAFGDDWPTVLAFLYERLRVYLVSDNREHFADGWARRTIALKQYAETS